MNELFYFEFQSDILIIAAVIVRTDTYLEYIAQIWAYLLWYIKEDLRFCFLTQMTWN